MRNQSFKRSFLRKMNLGRNSELRYPKRPGGSPPGKPSQLGDPEPDQPRTSASFNGRRVQEEKNLLQGPNPMALRPLHSQRLADLSTFLQTLTYKLGDYHSAGSVSGVPSSTDNKDGGPPTKFNVC